MLRTTGRLFSPLEGKLLICWADGLLETDDREKADQCNSHALSAFSMKKNLLYLGKAGTNVEKSIQSLKQGRGEQASGQLSSVDSHHRPTWILTQETGGMCRWCYRTTAHGG